MKALRKLAVAVMAVVMSIAMVAVAYAAPVEGETNPGSITIANPMVSSEGTPSEYKAYKIFDVTYNADKTSYAYTIAKSSPWYNTVNTYADTVDNGLTLTSTASNPDVYNVSIDSAKFNASDFAEILKNALINNSNLDAGYPFVGNGSGELVASGLPLGYYLVTTTTGALCNLTTTNPTVTVYDKNDFPDIDKKIILEDGEKVNTSNVAVGDTVNFELISKVPDMTGYEKYYFVVTDTMSAGLTYNEGSVGVKVGDKTLTFNKDYTAVLNQATNVLEIVFTNFIQYKEQRGADIVITYNAVLNDNAVVGVDGNPNAVKLVYSNNPNHDESGNPGDKPGPDSPTGVTPDAVTVTYVTGVKIEKVDDSNPVKFLPGAEFKIEGDKLNTVIVKKDVFTESADGTYWKLKDGSYTTEAPNDDTSHLYESVDTKYKWSESTTSITKPEKVEYKGIVGQDGTLMFNGLAAGSYTITEIEAPAGYNKLEGTIGLTIAWEQPADPVTAASECTWTYTWTDPTGTTTTGSSNTIRVENRTGSQLPSTGGMGTTVFYVVGGVLVVGAIAALLVRSRRSSRR